MPEGLTTGNVVVDALFAVIALALAGSLGAAIVTTVGANRRGIRGDALVKEQNGITGLKNLTDGQAVFIESLRKEIETLREEMRTKTDELEEKFEREVAYSNLLVRALNDHDIPIPERPTP